MQLSDVRPLTPITQEYAYFQSSGFSPKMEPVIEETNRWAHFQNSGGAAAGIHERRQRRDRVGGKGAAGLA